MHLLQQGSPGMHLLSSHLFLHLIPQSKQLQLHSTLHPVDRIANNNKNSIFI
jgi:hypothetical protein